MQFVSYAHFKFLLVFTRLSIFAVVVSSSPIPIIGPLVHLFLFTLYLLVEVRGTSLPDCFKYYPSLSPVIYITMYCFCIVSFQNMYHYTVLLPLSHLCLTTDLHRNILDAQFPFTFTCQSFPVLLQFVVE